MAKKRTRKKAVKRTIAWTKAATYPEPDPKPEVAAVEPKVDLDAGRQAVQAAKNLSRRARRIEHLEKQRRG